MMRLFLAALVLAVQSNAGTIVAVTFSGVWGGNLGPIQSGNAFSGTAAWDVSTVGAVVANQALLTSFSFTMPAAAGLTISGIPNANVSFAGAHWNGSQFDLLQINVRSTADNIFWVLFFGIAPGCSGVPACAAFSNASFTQNVLSSSYSLAGPTAVPEPSTGMLFLSALGLVCCRWRNHNR